MRDGTWWTMSHSERRRVCRSTARRVDWMRVEDVTAVYAQPPRLPVPASASEGAKTSSNTLLAQHAQQ